MAARLRPIKTLLIANRGEIALRILRTARRMGIGVVAVFSDADAETPHVRLADLAIRIGPAPAQDSYLNSAAIIAAAQSSGADAIHPGYGFLAENADFAMACDAAGLTFIGPPVAAIALMGDKGRARDLAIKLGVPVVPGSTGAQQDLAQAAGEIGYPVMLKPAAGGGGKGMHVVVDAAGFAPTLAIAQREANAAFGDARMIVEKYLAAPRHIEVQIFADHAGHVVHLFERDCSIQRRHQKVIEEAPAIRISAALLADLRRAAITCAKSCGYVGAGTVEFLVENGHFYFLEMNVRLQVEHPVTEAVTGLDLVEWQLRVAAGEALPLTQEQIKLTGHAIEARLCAEDPAHDFLPQAGRLTHLRLPDLPGIRVDAGPRAGDEIPPHYDSLIGKIISHAASRGAAVAQLAHALAVTEVAGVASNRTLLSAIIGTHDFVRGGMDTNFLGRHAAELVATTVPDATTLLLAAFAALRHAEDQAKRAGSQSPWQQTTGWRLGAWARTRLMLQSGAALHEIEIQYQPGGYAMTLASATLAVSGTLSADGTATVQIGAARLQARAIFTSTTLTLFSAGREHNFTLPDPYHPASARPTEDGQLTAPMPGTVVLVAVTAGQAVAKGDPLVVIEAMKMEHAILAPRNGIIAVLRVKTGDRVAMGAELVVMEPAP